MKIVKEKANDREVFIMDLHDSLFLKNGMLQK